MRTNGKNRKTIPYRGAKEETRDNVTVVLAWQTLTGLFLLPKSILSRDQTHSILKRNNPQTNGKIERRFQEYKGHRWRFDTALSFVDWYNDRIHGSLDLECFETLEETFIRKMQPENLAQQSSSAGLLNKQHLWLYHLTFRVL